MSVKINNCNKFPNQIGFEEMKMQQKFMMGLGKTLSNEETPFQNATGHMSGVRNYNQGLSNFSRSKQIREQ